MKHIFLRVTLVALLLLSMILPLRAAEPAVFTDSGAKNTPLSTVLDLRQAWESIRVPTRRFDETPSTTNPYRLGKLSGEFLDQNLDLLNFFRLSAGLPAVQYTEADNTDAQYGAVVLAASNTLAHDPPRPEGMDSGFYQRGCAAASTSNISVVQIGGADEAAVEENKLRAAVPMILRNYMNGYGAINRSSVPHRRWILSPTLQSVGIGCADSADSSMYQVLKIVRTQANNSARPDYDFIAWPASGNFPAQAITPDVPWSISLNPERFQTPDRGSLVITVTRQSDGRVWSLNASSSADSASGTFMLVDTQRYGVANCILFAFESGEKETYSGDYHVTVSGLSTRAGREAVLDYQMRFVDLENCAHEWLDWSTDVDPTCDDPGIRHRVCRDCGEREEEILPPLGHDWEISMLVEPSGKYRSGTAEFTCAQCGEQKMDALPLLVCQDQSCPCARFTDAPERGNWAHNGIDFVVENGIFNGTGATVFSPKGKMTRAMMVTVLWRIAGQPEGTKEYTFTDVDGSAYYAPAVRWASENGVVQGYSAQRFGPSDNVTREQAVTLLQRFFAPGSSGDADLSVFADAAKLSPYAQAPMRWAIENRVITGSANGSATYLLPSDGITREQTASVIMRCMINLE